jgi:hypothetical protein
MDQVHDGGDVKAMRETARTIGLTELLIDVRREHVMLLSAMDRDRARLTKALMILGVSDPEAK